MSLESVAQPTNAVASRPESNRHFDSGNGFVYRTNPFVRRIILAIGRTIGRVFLNIRVEGTQNLPRSREPLLVMSNHFGWFDAFILTLFLPFQPVFIIATESQRMWYVRWFMNLFDGIPIWRGQVDREAFRIALRMLDQGRSVGIFPEGGINPELAERIARGEQMTGEAPRARIGGKLARAKPGTALLATMSRKRVLPIALLGTDVIGDNLRRLRRSAVTVRVGPIFGPIQHSAMGTGKERRERLDEISDGMMRRVAVMFPPDKRGPYADALPATNMPPTPA